MAMNPRLLRPRASQQAAPCAYPASLLLHFDGDFTDSSANGLTVTAHGDAAISTTQSKFGGSSAYFDGDGDYLQIPSGEALNLTGEVPYTIEFWMWLESETGTYQTFFTRRSGSNWQWLFGFSYPDQRNLFFSATAQGSGGYSQCMSPQEIPLQQWIHVAACVDGGTASLFIDGVLVDQQPWATQPDNAADAFIADAGNSGEFFNGYIDDIRITKGVAVYDCAFIPPAAPLSACVTPVPTSREASLLLHFDGGFTDSSPNAFVATVAGDATISSTQSKFGGSSAYFDGTGDYLTFPDNNAFGLGDGDFAVEAWVWVYSFANNPCVCDTRSTAGGAGAAFYFGTDGSANFYRNGANFAFSGGVVQAESWTHVAWCRSGGIVSCFINGTPAGSLAESASLTENSLTVGTVIDFRSAGSDLHFDGYIDDLRITKGLAVYKGPFTPPTAPLPAIATPQPINASLCLNFDGSFTDESVNATTLTAYNGATISTAQSKFGGSSLYLEPTSYLAGSGGEPIVNFDGGAGTVEAWVYLTAHVPAGQYGGIVGPTTLSPQSGLSFGLGHSAGQSVMAATYGDAGAGGGGMLNLNQWHHVAYVVESDGVTLKYYLDGSLVNTHTLTGASDQLGVIVGNPIPASLMGFTGYIDGLRITKAALYCDEFTPPTAPPTPTAVPPCCVASAPPPPSCDPYGTYLYDACEGCDYGTWYADGECGQYFDAWSPGACC